MKFDKIIFREMEGLNRFIKEENIKEENIMSIVPVMERDNLYEYRAYCLIYKESYTKRIKRSKV